VNDLGEKCLAAHPLWTHHKAAGRIDRGARHLIARRFFRWHGFTGNHRLIDGAVPVEHDTIDRHLLAGTDPQLVARHDRFERDVLLGAVVTDKAGVFRREIEQRADGAAGLRSRAQFEDLAEQHQGDDDRGRLEIERDFSFGRAEGSREDPGASAATRL